MNTTNPKEDRIKRLENEISEKRKELSELKQTRYDEQVTNYLLKGPDGKSSNLSDLFGSSNELIVIHNMGKRCPYCTLWADGFNGMTQHFENRAGFVVVSPDDPDTQKKFAESRGWKFKMLSGEGSSFIKDMSFLRDDGMAMPGFSIFKKDDSGKIIRTTKDYFGPHDNYCGIWHIFDLLPNGINSWEPKFEYN